MSSLELVLIVPIIGTLNVYLALQSFVKIAEQKNGMISTTNATQRLRIVKQFMNMIKQYVLSVKILITLT
jgi:hypothetical protein